MSVPENPKESRDQVCVICVCYNTPSEALDLRKDLLAQSRADSVRLIIIDNSDRNPVGRVDETPECRFRTQLIKAEANLGYFGGAARAMGECLKSDLREARWVIVCNSDLSIEDREFIAKLVSAQLPSDCLVVAPSIHSSISQQDQNPHLLSRPSSFSMKLRKAVFSTYLTGFLYSMLSLASHKLRSRLRRRSKSQHEGPSARPIYAAQGSMFIFAREYFKRGGSLVYKPFLFGEEVFVAETVRALGGQILYCPELRVSHIEHVSTGVIRSRKMLQYFKEATRYCADTYF